MYREVDSNCSTWSIRGRRRRGEGGDLREEGGLNVGGGVWPDGDAGTLSQSASGALQAGVDLSHLDRPLQADHLQQLVAEVWREKGPQRVCVRDGETEEVIRKDIFYYSDNIQHDSPS